MLLRADCICIHRDPRPQRAVLGMCQWTPEPSTFHRDLVSAGAVQKSLCLWSRTSLCRSRGCSRKQHCLGTDLCYSHLWAQLLLHGSLLLVLLKSSADCSLLCGRDTEPRDQRCPFTGEASQSCSGSVATVTGHHSQRGARAGPRSCHSS